MPYAERTIYLIQKGARTPGNVLARRAVELDFPVRYVAKATGATRQTVYNWMFGGDILRPYQPLVERLTVILKDAATAESAWVKVCQEFNLKT